MKIDPGAIPLKSSVTEQDLKKKFDEVGKMYEEQFLRELVKAMRSTVAESSLIPKTQAEKIFQEQLDHKIIENWGDQGGLGLGSIISQQLVEKYGKLAKPSK